MDLGVIRGIGTAVLLFSFLALVWWAWSPAQRRRFDEAAQLPFLDEEKPSESGARGGAL